MSEALSNLTDTYNHHALVLGINIYSLHYYSALANCFSSCSAALNHVRTLRSHTLLLVTLLTSISAEETEERSPMMPFICWPSVLIPGGATSVCSETGCVWCSSPRGGRPKHTFLCHDHGKKTLLPTKRRKRTATSTFWPVCVGAGCCSPSSPSVAAFSAGLGSLSSLSPSSAGWAVIGGVSAPLSSKTESDVEKERMWEVMKNNKALSGNRFKL